MADEEKDQKNNAPEQEDLAKEVAEKRESIMRLQAEFENYRKALDREKQEYMKYAAEKIIIDLLDVADNFERAIPELRKKDPEGAAGMEMIYRQFMKVLEKHGVSAIEAEGKPFDPYSHEAFLQAEGDKPDGTVLAELQKGYMLNNKVIRHSKVTVCKNKKTCQETDARQPENA